MRKSKIKRPTKFTRTSISLPAELKRRMEAMGDDANWSAVAVAAFEAKLREMGSRRTVEIGEVVVGSWVK